MRINLLIREYLNLLFDDDIALFIGESLCTEAANYDRPNNYYIKDESFSLNLADDISYKLDKRLFVFINENTLNKNLYDLVQIGLNNNKHICIMIIKDPEHNYGTTLSLFNVRSFSGLAHSLGFNSMDLNFYFSKVTEVKKLLGFIQVLKGPSLGYLNATPNNTPPKLKVPYERMINLDDRNISKE